jgi:hypothetical protein
VHHGTVDPFASSSAEIDFAKQITASDALLFIFYLLIYLALLGFELRALHLLHRHFST